MVMTAKYKDSWGAWQGETIPVLSVGAPRNVRGKVTGSNWAVDYDVPSTLGHTGRQTRTQYFSKKTEAVSWIEGIKAS